MPRFPFDTPAPITVALDVYVGDIRFAVSDRSDTVVDVRPTDPDKTADVRAAESTRVEFDEATRRLSVVSKKPRNRFAMLGKRPESVEVTVALPTGSEVRGETGHGDLEADGVLGAVSVRTGLGTIRLAEAGPLRLRTALGGITVETANGATEVHSGASDVRIGTVNGAADVSTGNGAVRVGIVTGPTRVTTSNGSASVERALSDLTATAANGAVHIGEVAHGTVVATSKNGSVDVGVREGSAAWLELDSAAGRVHNELAPGEAPAAEGSMDTVTVRASTKLGDVTVRRVPQVEHAV